MHASSPARRALAALLAAAAIVLSALPAGAAEAAPEAPAPRPVEQAHARVTLPGGVSAPRGGRPLPVVVLLPDEAWDARRAWPYLDHLSSLGFAVVELWSVEDAPLGLAGADEAIASAAAGLGLHPPRVALLGFGAGARLALALAGPGRPAAALYPACHEASAPDPEARVMVLHPDDPSEARACAALVAGRPGARSARASPGAGHGWDASGGQGDGPTLLPHPDGSGVLARRLPARPDPWATFRASRAVSDFLVGGPAAHRFAERAP